MRHCHAFGKVITRGIAGTLCAATLVAGAAAMDARAAEPAKTPVPVDIWLRRPVTDPTQDARGNAVKIDLQGLTFDELKTYDLQYGGEFRFKGMHVRDLIAVYKPLLPTIDMILLHTANGMVIPVAMEYLRSNRQVFVALAMFRDGKWTTEFPASIRPDPAIKDARPIAFAGNKIVVGTEWRATKNTFTPWRHAGTLTGIELVESGPYYEQYRLRPKLQEHQGRAAYLARCHFCHAIKGFGGTFGPEFLKALPLDTNDGAKTVFEKVTLVDSTSKRLTHAMPNQSDFKMKEAEALLDWARDARTGTLGPYVPSYGEKVDWRR